MSEYDIHVNDFLDAPLQRVLAIDGLVPLPYLFIYFFFFGGGGGGGGFKYH